MVVAVACDENRRGAEFIIAPPVTPRRAARILPRNATASSAVSRSARQAIGLAYESSASGDIRPLRATALFEDFPMYRNATLKRLAMAAAFIAAAPAAFAATNAELYADTSKVVPVTDLKFYQNKEGLTIANGWGDPANGPHSNYIKMAGGTASGVHTHSESYYGVVIAGVVANEPPGSKQDRPLAPGSYWYQKGNEPHVTKCISQTECIFFVTAKGAFDYLPVK
jgi:hypothetical protein